jgi:hypothetical protein
MSSQPSTINSQPSVELHIEELILHGFSSGDHHRIGEAVQRELARLFAESRTPPALTQSAEIDRLDSGTIQIPAASKPETAGVQVARAVFGGLKQ